MDIVDQGCFIIDHLTNVRCHGTSYALNGTALRFGKVLAKGDAMFSVFAFSMVLLSTPPWIIKLWID